MRRTRAAPRLVAVLAGLWMVAEPGAAQSGFVARLSVDTVEVGEAFSLLVRVPVPAGSLVHFPDTLARTEFLESHTPVRWEAEPDDAGGATLTLEYQVLAYGVGMVPVPGFDVFVGPVAASSDGAPIPGGSTVGAWGTAPTSGPAYLRPLRVPRRGVWVNPVFTPEQIEVGVQPMPSADVVGSSWHWPSVLMGLGFAGLLALMLARAAPDWIARLRAHAGGPDGTTRWTPESSRRHALDELARLRAEGLADDGRTHELYTRSSGVVRTYVSQVRPQHGADLTSSELMGRLDETAGGPEKAPLVREMDVAEVVKFGRLRPEADAAEEHLRSLRTWVEKS
ncbi:MAG: hypothetical protein ABL963_07720 [Longimicrobiales bacterium]